VWWPFGKKAAVSTVARRSTATLKDGGHRPPLQL
jgi:hypothetical protein